MAVENNWGRSNFGPAEDARAEAYLQELVAKYPTPESIVDDYRHDVISQLAMPRRFPLPADQEVIKKMAADRNEVDRKAQEQSREAFLTTHVGPLLEAAALNRETIALIRGTDDWEISEFEAELEVWAQKQSDAALLDKMRDLLTQMHKIEESEESGKDGKIKILAEQFNQLY